MPKGREKIFAGALGFCWGFLGKATGLIPHTLITHSAYEVTVEVLDIVEGPLLGTEGESWIRDASVSKEFTEFLRVQALSIKACQEVNSWKSCLEPLIGTQDAESWKTSLKQLGETTTEQLLSQMWYGINQVNGNVLPSALTLPLNCLQSYQQVCLIVSRTSSITNINSRSAGSVLTICGHCTMTLNACHNGPRTPYPGWTLMTRIQTNVISHFM